LFIHINIELIETANLSGRGAFSVAFCVEVEEFMKQRKRARMVKNEEKKHYSVWKLFLVLIGSWFKLSLAFQNRVT